MEKKLYRQDIINQLLYMAYVRTNFSSLSLSHFKRDIFFLPFDFLKFLPIFCLAIVSKESVIISNLASFIAPKLNISFDSASKNISRFLSNPNYDFNFFFSKFITHILPTYKIKHFDKRVLIAIDHGDTKDRFTSLRFSLKIGKQSIPLWFRTFNFDIFISFYINIYIE